MAIGAPLTIGFGVDGLLLHMACILGFVLHASMGGRASVILRLWESHDKQESDKCGEGDGEPEEAAPAMLGRNVAGHDGSQEGAREVHGEVCAHL